MGVLAFFGPSRFRHPRGVLDLRGRDEIRQHYARQFAAFPPDLRHVTTAGESDVIGPGILAVDFEVAILGTDPTSGTSQVPVAHYRGLGVGVRTDPGWHVRLARVYPAAK